MKKSLTIAFLFPILVFAQEPVLSFAEILAQHRENYLAGFLKDPRSPLQEGDLENLRFFEANEQLQVRCNFEPTPDEKPFDLPTYSGITKPYRKYGTLIFELDGKPFTLAVYQSITNLSNPLYRNHLFLPFRDATNGESTYGGGRYMDLKITEVEAPGFVLDFNKCYNPWCAYSDGYNCPVPPSENTLEIEILAGEKQYEGERKMRKKE